MENAILELDGFKIELTPRQVAEAFCKLSSDRQALFFAEVEGIASKWKNWRGLHYLMIGDAVKEMGMKSPAATALASMASPLFAHTMRWIDGHDSYDRSQHVEVL